MYIGIDQFDDEFNGGIFMLDCIKLIGLSIIGIILLRIAVTIYRERKVKSTMQRMSISTLIILCISGYFYFTYGKKIYHNQFLNKELRNGIVNKIIPYEGSWFGDKAENLTEREYIEITKVKWFPKLPKGSQNISYDYEYEGFLPDYSFSISYDLPLNSKVETMNYKKDTFFKSRTFKIIGNKKRVTYSEGLW